MNNLEEIIKTLLYFSEKNKIQAIKYVINKENTEFREEIFNKYLIELFNKQTKLNVIKFAKDIFFLNDDEFGNIVVKSIYNIESLKNREVNNIIKNTTNILEKRTKFRYDALLIVSFNGFTVKNANINDTILLLGLNDLISYINKDRFSKNYKYMMYMNDNETSEQFENNLMEFEKLLNNNVSDKLSNLLSGNKKLYTWVTRQRYLYKKGHLNSSKIKKLNEVGFIFDENEYIWNKNYNELKKFYDEFGVIQIPNNDEKYKSLAKWVQRQRRAIRCGNMSEDKKNKLIKLGIFKVLQNKTYNCVNEVSNSSIMWDDIKEERWNQKLEEYIEYYKNRNLFEPVNKSTHSNLYRWVSVQRINYNKGILPEDKIKKLNENGFIFKLNEVKWEKYYAKLAEYYDEYGIVPVKYNDEYRGLASWLNRQRENFSKGKLSSYRKNKLVSIGALKDIDIWYENYNKLESLLTNKNKELNTSQKEEILRWFFVQKSMYDIGKLSKHKIDKLKEIGAL